MVDLVDEVLAKAPLETCENALLKIIIVNIDVNIDVDSNEWKERKGFFDILYI
jgi:hypothetical protein